MATQAPTVKVYYGKPMLPDVSRVLACLYEKDVEFKLIDMYEGHQMSADLFKLQASRAPVSGFEDGNTRLFESRAICRHIVEKYAERGNKYLLGRDLLERASIEQWLKSEKHSFDPPSWALVCHLAFNVEADQALITESERRLSKVLDVYEQRLAVSKFLAGDEFSLADLYHLPNSHYIVRSREWGYLFESRKNVSKWWEEISSRYSWQEVVKILNEVGLLEEVKVRSNGGYKFLVRKKLQLHSPSEEQKDLTDQEHPTHIPISTGKSIVQKSTTTPQSSLPLVFDPSSQKVSKIIQPMNIVDPVKQSVTPHGEKVQQIHQADTVNKFAYEPTTTKEALAGALSSQTKHEEQAYKEDSIAKSSAKEIAPDDQATADSKPLPQEKKEPTDTKLFSQQDTSSESSSEKKEESAKTTGADYRGQSADQQDTGEDNSSKSPKPTDAQGTSSEKLGEKKEENTQTTGADTKGWSADQQDTEKGKSSKAPESIDTKFSSQQDTTGEISSEKKEESAKTTEAEYKGESANQQDTGEDNSSKSSKSTVAQGTSENIGEKKEENTQTTGADTKGRSADQQDTEKGKSSKAPESIDTKFSSQQDTTGESSSEKKDESAKTTEAEYKGESANQQDTGEDNSSKSSKSTVAQGTSENIGEKKEENTQKTGADTKGRSDDQQDTEKVKPSKAPESTGTKFSSQQDATSESGTKFSSQQDTTSEKSSEKMEENAQTTGADTTGHSTDHGEVNSSNAPKSMESTSAKEPDPSTESKK